MVLDSDVDYLRELRGLVSSGRVTIEIDPRRLNGLDSPVHMEADVYQWAIGLIVLVAAAWWLGGSWSALGAAVIGLAIYATLGRRLIKQRLERRVREKALEDPVIWRKLWRYGGITLHAGDQNCAAPDGSWMRLTEALLTPAAR